MNALIQESLPSALAERLTEEQRQSVLEASRGQRMAAVAAALALNEANVLTLVAGAVGLEIATDIRPDRASLNLLPARLVHDYQIVPIAAPSATGPAGGEDQAPAPPDSRTVLDGEPDDVEHRAGRGFPGWIRYGIVHHLTCTCPA